MYPKAANMLHTLRQLVEDDELWRSILRGLNRDFYHQTVTTGQIEDYLSRETGKDLSAFFDQYLRTNQVPTLEYRRQGERLEFRYTHIVEGFDMPIRIVVGEESRWIFPDANWKSEPLPAGAVLTFDPNFYIATKPVEGAGPR